MAKSHPVGYPYVTPWGPHILCIFFDKPSNFEYFKGILLYDAVSIFNIFNHHDVNSYMAAATTVVLAWKAWMQIDLTSNFSPKPKLM